LATNIRHWLEELGLDKYADVFTENEIGVSALPLITEEDLKEIGVALGARRQLMSAIGELAATSKHSSTRQEANVAAGARRQVTALFADISGYTRLSNTMDAEETHAMLNGFFTAVDEVVRRYGGTVDKHIGDAVMAVFGAPIAHTDDPERALRAAQDIHFAVAALSPPLKVHIGIASGQVVASPTGSEKHREYTVTGDSVNLAARLTDLAKADQTLASASVQRALGERFKGDALGEQLIAGLLEPVTVYRVGSIDAKPLNQKPFVGRRRELDLCAAAVSRCIESGAGETFVFRGEAGIGKSRMLDEFERLAVTEGFRSHTGLNMDFGAGRGQDAVGALVRSLLAIAANSDKKSRLVAAERIFDDGLLKTEQRVFLYDLLDLEPPAAQRDLYDSMNNSSRVLGKQNTVAELAQALSRHQPILLRIEDLHWADTIVLEQVALLAQTTANCGMLLLLTTRLAGDPLNSDWCQKISDTKIETLDLGAMALSEAAELAQAFDGLSEKLVQDCIARAGGNPLFLEQLLRNADQIGTGELPGSVQGIVQARLDALPQRDRLALQAASILGQRFSLSALGAVMDDSDYNAGVLLDLALVHSAGEDFHFSNALIRDGVYASLLRPSKKDLHGRAAEYYHTRDVILHAEHLEQAEDEGAAEAFIAAARQQTEGFRYDHALRMVERALNLDCAMNTAFELRCLQGELLKDIRRIVDSATAFEKALEITENDEQFCRANLGLATVLRILNQHDKAMETLERCQGIAEKNELHGLLAEMHYLRGSLNLTLGRVDNMRQEHQKSLDYAQIIASPEAEARALGGLADAGYADGRMLTANHFFARCVELAEQKNLARINATYKPMLAWSELLLLKLDQAIDTALSAVIVTAQTGNARGEMIAHNCLSEIHLYRRNYEDMRIHGDKALEISHRIGSKRFEVIGLQTHADYQLYQDGDHQAALVTLKDAYQKSMATAPGFRGSMILGQLALAAVTREERDWALQEGERLLVNSQGHNHYMFRIYAIEVCLCQKDWDSVLRHATAFESYVADEPTDWTNFYIRRGRALTAIGSGSRNHETIAELNDLKIVATSIGLNEALSKIDTALAECDV
jgi:class 3 adenylate cyclase/tetratricopeptide (TPR) repeat protein